MTGLTTVKMLSVSPIKNIVAVKTKGKFKEELWNKRSHYTNEQMPVSDLEAISSKHTHRGNNHQSSHFRVEKL